VRLPLAGLAFGVAGAIASHHFGALSVAVPLLCGEAWRLLQRRRLDLPVYLAGLAGASMLLATVPLMAQTHAALLAHVRDSAVVLRQAGPEGHRRLARDDRFSGCSLPSRSRSCHHVVGPAIAIGICECADTRS